MPAVTKLASALAAAALAAAACALPAAAAPRPGPRLSPDRADVFLVSRSGDSVRRIIGGGVEPVAWSPDGRLIADGNTVHGRAVVEIRTASGRLLRRFDAGSRYIQTWLAFSPNGRWIAFTSGYYNKSREADDARLVVVPVAGGRRRVLADLAHGELRWTPDSRSILYLRDDVIGSYPGTPPIARTIRSVDVDGSHGHLVVRRATDEFVISPNGNLVAFLRRIHGSDYELRTVEPSGDDDTLVDTYHYASYLHWAPLRRGVWLYGARGSSGRLLVETLRGRTTGLPSLGPVDWSPDGQLLAGLDGDRVVTVRPDGTHRRVLFRFRLSPSEYTTYVACRPIEWAPDSSRFFIGCSQGETD